MSSRRRSPRLADCPSNEIAERFDVSVRTALRYVQALRNAGEPLDEHLDGKRKVWRLHPAARRETITLSTTQMVSLFLSLAGFSDFLAGTGFKEDLDDVFKKLEVTLRKRDYDTRNLDRKNLRRQRSATPLR